jgi:hypothetical protein
VMEYVGRTSLKQVGRQATGGGHRLRWKSCPLGYLRRAVYNDLSRRTSW